MQEVIGSTPLSSTKDKSLAWQGFYPLISAKDTIQLKLAFDNHPHLH
jgi:hypothetical protein